MECLPSTLSEFRERAYWDRFFKERRGAPFEWYGSFKDFKEPLGALNLLGGPCSGQEGPLVLHVGCGNSTLAKELYDEGYKHIINVDFSPVVIEEMRTRWAGIASLEWRCLDIRGRGLQDAFLRPSSEAPAGSSSPPFDLVIDKGFLDAYLSVDSKETLPSQTVSTEQHQYDYRTAAQEYFEAVLDVLKPGGSFVLISLAQDYLLKEFVRFFLLRRVEVDVFPCRSSEPWHSEASTGRLQPFLIRVKKSVSEAEPPQGDTSATTQVPNCIMAETPGRGGPETFPLWELTRRVAAVSRWQTQDFLARMQSPGKRVLLHVGGGGGTFARCTVAAYDTLHKAHAAKGQTASLLVPPGQELAWSFATPEGNQQVAEQLEAARLLVVTFPIGFASDEVQEVQPLEWRKTIEDAQKTLGPLLKEFALPNNQTIPILTLSEQAPVRELLCREASPLAGQILVRDVQDTSVSDEAEANEAAGKGTAKASRKTKKALARRDRDRDYQRLLRQLIFSCNPNTLQSEIKIRVPKGASSADSSKVEFLIQEPASAYHCAIVTAFAFSKKVVAAPWGATSGIDAVLLGLGGGVLGGLLHRLFGSCGLSLTCVELDPIVAEIAKKLFGFKEVEAPLLRVVDGEGKQFVENLPKESLDILILDINSGETGDALVCPPRVFAETDFLITARQRLRPGGVLITNLLCRCPDTRTELLDNMKKHFASLAVINVPEDVNEVAVMVAEDPSLHNLKGNVSSSELLKRLQHLERCYLQHTGGKRGWLTGQTMKDWAGRVRPWPLPKSSAKNGR